MTTTAESAIGLTPDTTSGGAPHVTGRVVLLVFFTVFLDMIGFGIVIPLLPFYVQSMGGGAQTVGLILGSFSLMQLLATPVLGRLSDRYGRRPVICLSLAGNAIAMLLFAFATRVAWLPLLFASRILAGATAGNLGACQATVADVTAGADRARGMGRIGAGIGLGMVLGPVLASLLIHRGAWAPPLGASVLAALDLIAVIVFMPETHPRVLEARAGRQSSSAAGSTPPKGESVLTVLRETPVGFVLALYFLTFLCLTNIQVALALLAHERLGWGAAAVGHAFGLFGLVTLLVQGGLIGLLVRRIGRSAVLLLGALLLMIGLASIADAHERALLLFGIVAMGTGVGLTNPVLATLASDYAGPARQGAVLGIAQSAGGLARAVGPVWSGFLFARYGAGAPFWGGVCAAALAFVICLTLGRRGAAGTAGGALYASGAKG